MLNELLKIRIIFFGFLQHCNAYSQVINDSLKSITISSSQTVPQSYKKEVLQLSDLKSSSSLANILEEKTSLYIKSYGKGQLSSISVRGTGASQTQMYWNGFKINSVTLGQTDLSLLPTFFIDNAAVHYGNSSIADGSGGLGGSIQLNNSLKIDSGFSGSVEQEIGSFGNYTTAVKINIGKLKWQHQLKALYLRGENNFSFTDLSRIEKPIVKQINNEVEQAGVQYSGLFKVSDNDLIKATLYFFNSDRNNPSIIGASASKQNIKDVNFRSVLEWKSFKEKYSSVLKVSGFVDNTNYTDSISRIFSKTLINTFQSQYKVKFYLFDNLKVEPVIQVVSNQVKSNGFDKNINRTQSALLLKLEHNFNRFSYDVMLRQEIVNTKALPFVYGLGGNYKLLKRDLLTAKASFSKNYRIPTLNDLYWNPGGNLNLKPETGWSGEVGLESNIKRNKLSVFAFYGLIDNWIQWQPISGSYWTPKNIKRVESKGIEFKYETSIQLKKLKSTLRLNLNYSYTESTNKSVNLIDNTIGKTLIYVPNHNLSFTTKFQTPHFELSYNQNYTSKVYIDASNSIYLPYYLPANITISKSVFLNKNKINTSFSIGNVFNEEYQVVANRPLPGINYTFSVKYLF